MVTNELKEYVKQKNVEKIRKELLAIWNTNPDMGNGEFQENLKYAVDSLGEDKIFVPFSGEFQKKSSKEEWTTSYVAKIYLHLRKEFSKELIEHLEQVAPVAYQEKIAQRDLLQQTTQKTRNIQKKSEKKKRFRVICVIIVTIVIICLIAFGIRKL